MDVIQTLVKGRDDVFLKRNSLKVGSGSNLLFALLLFFRFSLFTVKRKANSTSKE